jgi:hypothetical protein
LGGEQGKALVEAAGSVIADWEDEICGTPPRPHPGPVFGIASQLANVAAGFHGESGLASSLRDVAGTLVSKALGEREE